MEGARHSVPGNKIKTSETNNFNLASNNMIHTDSNPQLENFKFVR